VCATKYIQVLNIGFGKQAQGRSAGKTEESPPKSSNSREKKTVPGSLNKLFLSLTQRHQVKQSQKPTRCLAAQSQRNKATTSQTNKTTKQQQGAANQTNAPHVSHPALARVGCQQSHPHNAQATHKQRTDFCWLVGAGAS
jgi:hypothetical protein